MGQGDRVGRHRMSGVEKSGSSIFGVPFWTGYIISGATLCIFALRAGIWKDLEPNGVAGLFLGALGVIAPMFGIILQAVSDLILAMCRGRLRFWHIAVLLAIVALCVVLGYLNLNRAGGSDGGFIMPW